MDDPTGAEARLSAVLRAWGRAGVTAAEVSATMEQLSQAIERADRVLAAWGLSVEEMYALRQAGNLDEIRHRCRAAGIDVDSP